jgi:CRP/FNR family transcriptional regulator, cyclic AMP receptor protein
MSGQRFRSDHSGVRGDEARGVRLLAVEPDLGADLSGESLRRATEHAVFPTVELDAGPLLIDELREAPGVRDKLHGFLIIEGSLTVNLGMSGRICTRLISPRELVLLDGVETDSIPIEWEWAVLTPARLMLFDARLHAIGRHWPPLMGAILERAAQQTRNAFLQQAISQLPRVEERLLALFWSIADRVGVVRPDGVWLPLSATHDTLAQMVGAQRPTVSLGLSRLADGGLVRAEGDGWLLSRESLGAFAHTPMPDTLSESQSEPDPGEPEPAPS